MHRLVARSLLILPLLVFGCSDNAVAPGGNDLATPLMVADMAGLDADMMLQGRDPTDHPPLLQMDYFGGTTFASMEVWTIVWAGDEALGARMNEFVDWAVQSDEWWLTAMKEYGVGKGKAMGVLVINAAKPATLDDTAVGPLIRAHIAGTVAGDTQWPTPNANTVFAFMVPVTTHSTMFGAQGCTSGGAGGEYGGYHSETKIATGSKVYVPYAINLQCDGFAGNTLFDALTYVTSHELAETATDGHPQTKPAYVSQSASQNGLGGENGDLCNGLQNSYVASQAEPDAGTIDNTYFVTRLWSNAAAAAGNLDPCQPAPSNKPYFNVAVESSPAMEPRTPDIMIQTDANGTAMVQAQFEPFAFGDVGSIKWSLQTDVGTGVTLVPTSGTANAGDTVRFMINVTKQAQPGGYPIDLFTQSAKGGHNQWTSSITIQ